ncbi:MAG: hypothetical protein FD167_3317 [bacterium]|nr:MAG: hypothetical protein FD167_3317 [bacterium]
MPISLPIYSESYRPSSDWVKSITQKQVTLERLLPLDSILQNKIEKYLLIKQITHNLQLSDINVGEKNINILVEKEEYFDDSLAIVVKNFASAIRYINTLVNNATDKSKVILTSDLLRGLHALIFSGIDQKAGFYRETPGKSLTPTHQPIEPDFLPIIVDNALEWFNAESFRELHPLEQAWLVHLRVIDLQPFEQGNSRLARLVASLYAQRANLFSIIVNASEREFYTYAVNNALMMITQPGVELFARSVIQTYDEIFSIIEQNKL